MRPYEPFRDFSQLFSHGSPGGVSCHCERSTLRRDHSAVGQWRTVHLSGPCSKESPGGVERLLGASENCGEMHGRLEVASAQKAESGIGRYDLDSEAWTMLRLMLVFFWRGLFAWQSPASGLFGSFWICLVIEWHGRSKEKQINLPFYQAADHRQWNAVALPSHVIDCSISFCAGNERTWFAISSHMYIYIIYIILYINEKWERYGEIMEQFDRTI